MGLRGPAPKPSRLEELDGKPGKRSRGKNEVKPKGGDLACPDFVNGEAEKEWHRAILSMPPGFYTQADVSALAVYCLAWSLYRDAVQQIDREGMTSTGSTGQLVIHPAVAIAKQQAEIILRAGAQLGMSPAARVRLDAPEKDPAESGEFGSLIGPKRSYNLSKH